MQQSSLQATWTTQSQFWAMIDSQGNVIMTDIAGSRVVGVSLDRYRAMEQAASEALSKAEEYQKMLEEHGLIKKELTPEEQIAALSEQVRMLTEIVTSQIKQEPKDGLGTNTVDSKRFIASKQSVASKTGTGKDIS